MFGFALVILAGCAKIPQGAKAVKPFNSGKYLGKWYEIGRLDFFFEHGLNNVTATYTLNSDGSIKVVNRGYDYTAKKWKESEGKARFTGDSDEAKLEVSFFGPFYSGYNVIAIDERYTCALVAGKNLDYLWLLSRDTTMPQDMKQKHLKIAADIGYDTSKLIYTDHDVQ